MSRWFRHYAGMVRDDKLVRVSIKSKQPVERVLWVWGAILESAAELNTDGRYSFDAAEAARFLSCKASELRAIERQLEAAGHTYMGAVIKWGDRQFKSDKSTGRVQKFRATKRNADETLQERSGNAPETETETDKIPRQGSSSLGEGDAREPPFRVIGGAR